MKTKELIKQLSKFPPDTRVVVRGYEEGYDDIAEAKEIDIFLYVHEAWYSGQHDTTDEYDEGCKKVKAVFIRDVSGNERKRSET